MDAVIAEMPVQIKLPESLIRLFKNLQQAEADDTISVAMRAEMERQLAKAADRKARELEAIRIPGITALSTIKVAATYRKKADEHRRKAALIEGLARIA